MKNICVVLLLMVLMVAASGHEICGRNEKYMECGTACPPTCQKIRDNNPLMCNKMCIPGCFCAEGFVRDVKRNNQCVLEKECADRDYL